MARELTEKQRRFVEAYVGEAQGNATKAARLAGYRGTDAVIQVQASENIRKPMIAEAIRKAREPSTKAYIATREDRQSLLTRFLSDDGEKTKDRLKAIELLGKMHGDFLDRVEHTGAVDVNVVHVYLPGNGRDK